MDTKADIQFFPDSQLAGAGVLVNSPAARHALSPFISPGFIVGKERSGTTLLSAILNRHADLCVTYETDFLYALSTYPGGEEGFVQDWPQSLIKLVDRMHPTQGWSKPSNQVLKRVGSRRLSGKEAFLALGDTIAEANGKKLWIEKTPNHLLCIGFIRKLFPSAPIIHIVRDGRDVANSLVQVDFGSERYIENLWRWRQSVSQGRQALTHDPMAVAVRYEDLVRQPEAVIRALCSFLGIRYTNNLLVPDGSEHSLIEQGKAHMKQAAGKISSNKLEVWRKTLSPMDLRYAEAIARDELKAWGYPIENFSGKPVRIGVKETLMYDNRHGNLIDGFLTELTGDRYAEIQGINKLSSHDVCNPFLDVLITDEDLTEVFQKLRGIKLLQKIIQWVWSISRLRRSGTKIVWIFHLRLAESRRWRLRRYLERRMCQVATAVIWKNASQGDFYEALSILNMPNSDKFIDLEAPESPTALRQKLL